MGEEERRGSGINGGIGKWRGGGGRQMEGETEMEGGERESEKERRVGGGIWRCLR